jgi:hypothetical protein
VLKTPSRTAGLAPLLLCLTLGLAACGGGGGGSSDADKIKSAVQKFAKASDKSGCDLVTQHYIETETGKTGDAARKDCEQNFSGGAPKDLKVGAPAIAGSKATVTATGDGDSAKVSLVKEGSDWKIDAVEAAGSSKSSSSGSGASGASGTASAAPTKAAFVAQVEKICGATGGEIARIKKSSENTDDLTVLSGALDSFAAMETGLSREISALTPPSGDESDVAGLTAGLDAVASASTKAGAAARRKDSNALGTLADQARTASKSFEAKARAYGLTPTGGCRPTQ